MNFKGHCEKTLKQVTVVRINSKILIYNGKIDVV